MTSCNQSYNRTGPEICASRGFTLIELMIAVAILAIVMGIAIPSYSQWVIEAGRADGKSQLFQVAQQLERCMTRFSSYSDGACGVQDGDTIQSEKGKYQITTDIDATTFTLTAEPLGGQTKDDECKGYTLTSAGERGIKSGSEGTVDDCW